MQETPLNHVTFRIISQKKLASSGIPHFSRRERHVHLLKSFHKQNVITAGHMPNFLNSSDFFPRDLNPR
jgi:hypothetical protein